MNIRTGCLPVWAAAGAAVLTAQCAAAPRAGAPAPDIVLDCAAGDIRHTFRISPDTHTVEDLSVSPARPGVADVSDTGYRLQFHERRDNYDLILLVDRGSGRGTRTLFDDEQQAINGHGGTDTITCTPRPQ